MWHFLSCNLLKGHAITLRHNNIVQLVASWVRRASGSAIVEPNHLGFGNRQRPDLNIILGADNFLVDVVVTHPGAPTYSAINQEPLAVAIAAEKRKVNHYKDLVNAAQVKFSAFAIETFGGMGPSALAVTKTIAKFAGQAGGIWSTNIVRRGICSSIAMATQRGNAHTVSVGLQSSQERSHILRHRQGAGDDGM